MAAISCRSTAPTTCKTPGERITGKNRDSGTGQKTYPLNSGSSITFTQSVPRRFDSYVGKKHLIPRTVIFAAELFSPRLFIRTANQSCEDIAGFAPCRPISAEGLGIRLFIQY